MGLNDLTAIELQGVVYTWFNDTQISKFEDVREVSLSMVKYALEKDYSLIQKTNAETQQVISELIARGISQKLAPDDIRKEIIRMTDEGDLELSSLKTSDGKIISLQTRAANIARTELFKTYQDSKDNLVNQFMDDPIAVWRTAEDGSVRDDHRFLNGKAKRLSDWLIKPGQKVNCRCDFDYYEARDYEGKVYSAPIVTPSGERY